MKQYLDLVKDVLENGALKHNRTGVDTISLFGRMFEYDMSSGRFPLLTTKKMGCKSIFAELEMFIHGIHDKTYLHERNCHIWDEWCSPLKVPYGHDKETLCKMKEENELGPIYGAQWVNWNNSGINQLRNAIETLKKDPTDRRLLVIAWNPEKLNEMALPPCHYGFQLYSAGDGKLSLSWLQRSCDLGLGIPYDIASYAMLLLLICQETGLTPDKLVGFLGDCHIYENQIEIMKEQIARVPKESPIIKVTNTFDGWKIEDWKYTDFELTEYNPYPPLKKVNVAI